MLDINLLPWREQLASERRIKQGLEAGAAVLLAVLVLLVLHVTLGFQLQAAKARLSQTQSGLARLNQRLEELRQIYRELDYQKLPDMDLSAIFNHQRQILHFLRRLAQVMPRDLYARQISFDGQTWLIEGLSALTGEILRFAEGLKSGSKDGNLSLKRKNGLFYYQLRLEAGL